MQVEVYSGTEKVRLFLNGKLIGESPTGRDQEFRATFSVPYAPGTLKVVGIGVIELWQKSSNNRRQPNPIAPDGGPSSSSG